MFSSKGPVFISVVSLHHLHVFLSDTHVEGGVAIVTIQPVSRGAHLDDLL